jgi:hypothetical protein|tara:strand:- start:765 stop:926 length:162 start_codon:yes stop_codon:yes gene_type:complete
MTKKHKCCGRVRCELESKATAELQEEVREELNVPDKSIAELLNSEDNTENDKN